MGDRGRAAALGLELTDHEKALVGAALERLAAAS
jgi:hypothetical protein